MHCLIATGACVHFMKHVGFHRVWPCPSAPVPIDPLC